MTKRRDYRAEILEELARCPADGISLKKKLKVGPIGNILRKMERGGDIRWHHPPGVDGVWKLPYMKEEKK